jgi:hypothetical protein
MGRTVLAVCLIVLSCCLHLAEAQTRYSVDEFSAENFAAYADTVQFYYLVASFPYNTPSEIT